MRSGLVKLPDPPTKGLKTKLKVAEKAVGQMRKLHNEVGAATLQTQIVQAYALIAIAEELHTLNNNKEGTNVHKSEDSD